MKKDCVKYIKQQLELTSMKECKLLVYEQIHCHVRGTFQAHSSAGFLLTALLTTCQNTTCKSDQNVTYSPTRTLTIFGDYDILAQKP